jgi:hypothetical protein
MSLKTTLKSCAAFLRSRVGLHQATLPARAVTRPVLSGLRHCCARSECYRVSPTATLAPVQPRSALRRLRATRQRANYGSPEARLAKWLAHATCVHTTGPCSQANILSPYRRDYRRKHRESTGLRCGPDDPSASGRRPYVRRCREMVAKLAPRHHDVHCAHIP